MPDPQPMTKLAASSSAQPDFIGLSKFLMRPFLDSPESLRVDCEVVQSRSRVLIRMAFDGEDKGRVFGRGGRNIQAVRTVLQSIAQFHGLTAHLDIYGGQPSPDRDSRPDDSSGPHRGPRRGISRPRPPSGER